MVADHLIHSQAVDAIINGFILVAVGDGAITIIIMP
jgi:hypothetical protein